MYSKFKVFVLIGCFLLIATTALAENFWYFHSGHTIKYTRAKSDGTSWIVTMTIGAGGQNVCGRNDYYKVDEYNYDNLGETDTKYLRVTENAGYQCQDPSGTPIEIMFFQTGPEGTGWSYGTDTDGVKFQVVAQRNFGNYFVIRRYSIEGGVNKPAVFNHFSRGFGLMKEVDNWVADNAPWSQVRHGFRGRTLYVNFTGLGLYAYDYDGSGSWTRINTVVGDKMVAAGPNLYVTFPGYGLYLWDGTALSRINKAIPANMVTIGFTLYATYPGIGLFKYTADGNWTKINSAVPANMVVSGTDLYCAYPGVGLFKYEQNNSTWTKINNVIPANMVPGQ